MISKCKGDPLSSFKCLDNETVVRKKEIFKRIYFGARNQTVMYENQNIILNGEEEEGTHGIVSGLTSTKIPLARLEVWKFRNIGVGI